MGERSSIEVVRRVFDDKDGYWLEVAGDADGLGCVRICAANADMKEYWGGIDFTMPPDFARKLGEALIACALEQERAKS